VSCSPLEIHLKAAAISGSQQEKCALSPVAIPVVRPENAG
jgi:hypothetical protein